MKFLLPSAAVGRNQRRGSSSFSGESYETWESRAIRLALDSWYSQDSSRNDGRGNLRKVQKISP